MVDKTLRCRHEIKYVITESKALQLENFIKTHLHLDRYCKLQPNHRYPIVSSYLDSDNFKLCRESLEGHRNRFKLRIRSYSEDPDYPRFVEIKRRINTIIYKSRARVTHDQVQTIFQGRSIELKNRTDKDTWDQFRLYMNTINAKPVVLIRYMRRAYENDSENRVRVTFDRNLCYKITNKPVIVLNGPGWRPNNVGGVILEIKFTGRYPAWISRMAECLNIRQRSMSKYGSSIQNACLLKFCAPKIPIHNL